MKKVTVVLSGLGAAGFSTIAIMEFFQKHGVTPNTIVGCSTAAFVAALWAQGCDSKDAASLIRQAYLATLKPQIDHYTSFFFFTGPKKGFHIDHGLLKADKTKEAFRQVFNKTLVEELPIKTFFHTTNIQNGEPYLIKSGSIAQAVYAASAILPFNPPIHLHNLWLASGLFSESLPLRALLDESADIIVAADIINKSENKNERFLNHYANFVDKAFKISSMPYTALIYDLHNNEIMIIPIEIKLKELNEPLEALEYSISFARKNIEDRGDAILDSLK